MKTLYRAQKEALDRYFIHLSLFGYMDNVRTYLVLFATLLIDSVDMFKDYITEEFKKDLERILKSLDCCNCAINWTDYSDATTPSFITNENCDTEVINTNALHIGPCNAEVEGVNVDI